ncbi:MAG: glycoside hydrolase family 31 protein [Bacillota bacterium]|nr:glycoside hydrolase family 31 protein [Bacillota bacterium]
MKIVKNVLISLLTLGIVFCGIGPYKTIQVKALSVSSYAADTNGVTFTMNSGKMRLQVCKEDIIRVQYTTASSIPSKTSLSVNKVWDKPSFNVTESGDTVIITTSRMKAKVNKSNGSIAYTDLSDKVVLSEDSTNSKSLTPATVEGVSTNKIQTIFNSPTDEALFGLGQTQDSVMNRKGTTAHLANGNMWIYIPVLVSNKGYGIFWDNYSASDFYGNDSSNTKYRYVSEAGDMVDYYYFYGPSIDQVVAGYRTATGSAPLYPKWAYGLFQSKDYYNSQSELLAVKDGYRNNKIPLDCIVQDWNYWSPYTWGSHFMDESRYPNPTTLMNTLHSANVHGMISIWPEYEYTSSPKKTGDQDNYNALNSIGALFPSGGNHHFYDTLNANARTLVYQQIYDRLIGKYGWDGIWADNTEPQAYPDSVNMRTVNTALGKGAFYINAYPLGHSEALYEGWRKVGPSQKRVYILTRSGFAGQQRYGTTCWSGDIDCNFATFAKQIPAGLNFSITGMPYWTTDIGGYWGHPGRVDWTTSANNEMFTRWFQFGAFNPIFRVHGGGSRELYGSQWSASTKATLLKFDNLRYRLMPYIYSLAWKVTNESYSMMRPLVFDYQNDSNVYNIKDQFLFGPSFLVNPVTTAGATSRSVYFPSGTWYDFWSGSTVNGGNRATVNAPLSDMPLYVKAGSIVPMGPYIQYASQSIDPLEIRIYKGQNGAFTLYEDEGDTYNYESGKYSQIKFTWNESTQKLTIGARSGSYTGMPTNRTFNIVWVSPNHGNGVDVGTADQVVKYDGSEVVVSSGSTPNSPTPTPSSTPTSTPASQSTLYEAENGTLSGGTQVVQTGTGWSGTGKIAYFDASVGANCTMNVNVPTAGNYQVDFRYLVGFTTDQTESIYINGTHVKDVTFPVTGNWTDTWATVSDNFALNAGSNTIKVQHDSGDGAIELDYIKLYSNNTSMTPTPTSTPSSVSSIDLNNDGVINMADVILLATRFNTVKGNAGYVELYDVNKDGAINMADVILIAAKFNTVV